MVKGNPADISAWTTLLRQVPEKKTTADEQRIRETLRKLLDGYAATTDMPGCIFFPELLEIYPDAMVVCTVRDPDAWVKSMHHVANHAVRQILRFVLLPLPGVRHLPDYINALRVCYIHHYGEREPLTKHTYYRHIEWLKEVVPPEKLVFFDVRDGWGPLCAALGKEIPNVPFPRLNDGQAIDRVAAETIAKGMKRWGVILGVVVSAASVGTYYWRNWSG